MKIYTVYKVKLKEIFKHMAAKAKNVQAFIDAWRGECFWEVIMELHYHEIYLL